jgi:hypothetical protein
MGDPLKPFFGLSGGHLSDQAVSETGANSIFAWKNLQI